MAFLQEKQNPIQFLSSSVSDDYRSVGTISGLRIDVQNHHSDDVLLRQGVVQTTRSKAFKNQGFAHRNQDISIGTDSVLTRQESFYISPEIDTIDIYGGKSPAGIRNENIPASSFFDLKKIYSIDWLRNKNYFASQPLFFGDDSARSTNIILSSSFSSTPHGRTSQQSQYSQIPNRERQEESYLQRFSAPGDSLTLTIGNLDFFESKKSAWNDLNFRNLRLRETNISEWKNDIVSSSFESTSGDSAVSSGSFHNQFVKIPIPGKIEDTWWAKQSMSSSYQDYWSLQILQKSDAQIGIFPRPDSSRSRDMMFDKNDLSSCPVLLTQKKSKSSLLAQNRWNIQQEDSSNILSVQQAPLLYSENLFVKLLNGKEYKCLKPFSPFGEEYRSYLDYGGTAGEYRQIIEEPRFSIPKNCEKFSIQKTVWPKKSRAFLPELIKRENYDFPWKSSSLEMFQTGPEVNSANQIYLYGFITSSFCAWPMEVFSDPETSYSVNGEMMQGDNDASFQSSLFNPYSSHGSERYFHCSYGRIIYDYLFANSSRIPLNAVHESFSVGHSPVFYNQSLKKQIKQFSGYSVIPEYRIDSEIESILNNHAVPALSQFSLSASGSFDFDSFLSGTQASETNLETLKNQSEKWANSDFVFDKSVLSAGNPKAIKLNFSAITNFVPYEGFYPSQRVLQLSNLFALNYFPLMERSGASATYATAYKPIFHLLTNCIRAGVALDYPVMMKDDLTNVALLRNPITGLTYSPFGFINGSDLVLTSSHKTTYTSSVNALYLTRIPFESIWNPYQAFRGKNILDWDIEVADLNSTASILANSVIYDRAAENFIAESQRFFLRNGSSCLSKLESSPSHEWASPKLFMTDGTTSSYPQTYMMDVVVKKHNLTNHDALSFYGHHPHIYHAPFYWAAPWLSLLSGSFKEQTLTTGSWLKFTSSHANNESFARVTFDLNYIKAIDPVRYSKIIGGDSLSVNDIISFSKVQYFNQSVEDQLSSIPGGTPQTFMKMEAGINLFEKTQNDKWVIYPKGEFPNFDFSEVSTRSRDYSETSSIGNVIRGMWHQYISMPTQSSFYSANSGLFLSVRDVPTASYGNSLTYDAYRSSATGSLAKLCGFNTSESQRIGQIEEKNIYEAVLVIPVIEDCGKERFIELSIDKFENSFCKQKIENGMDHCVSLAKKYVFPAYLDFIFERMTSKGPMRYDEYKMAKPFAFYIFEFSEKMSQKDLADVWQGVAPRSHFAMTEKEMSIEHRLGDNEMLQEKDITESLRFKMIKIKRRAESSYQNVMNDVLENKKDKIYRHSYNWPYDFFSLIEFGKLDVKLEFLASNKDGIIDPLFKNGIIDPLFKLMNEELFSKKSFSSDAQMHIMQIVRKTIIDPLFNRAIIDPLFKNKIIDPLFFTSIIDPLFRNHIVDPLFKDGIIDPLFVVSIIDPLFKNAQQNIIDPLFDSK